MHLCWTSSIATIQAGDQLCWERPGVLVNRGSLRDLRGGFVRPGEEMAFEHSKHKFYKEVIKVLYYKYSQCETEKQD